MRTPDTDEYVGKTIAYKYRVEALIGEGGMGKVFRARQLSLDKVVVLKVLRHTLLSDERTVARFQREAKAASRLNHPNSISVLDFGQAEDGALYIAMEYVAGQDLHQILSREWPLNEGRVVRIVSQVLSALSDAHGAGVIHRDLKPENIMVEPRRNEPDFVKVLDFGIAKITDSTDDGPALTRAGFVCGTPEYMSPEQARGSQLDHRSDLYAVGVILYQLMTGLLPFESDSAVGFATKHLTEEPPPPTRRRPDARISPAMERLILRALSKNPADRPASAEAFKAELQAVDKERRRNEAAPRRAAANSSAVLAPLPRKSAAGPQQGDVRDATVPGWGNEVTMEATVRALPGVLEPLPANADAMDATREQTDSLVHTQPGAGGNGGVAFFFKSLTILLVLAAAGFFAYYFFMGGGGGNKDLPYALPNNAPVPAGSNHTAVGASPDVPLYDRAIVSGARNVERALELTREGDKALQRADVGMAASKYREAFGRSGDPELALKLGEMYWHRPNPDKEEARGWWNRHLREQPSSKARALIEQRLGGTVAQPSSP
ncbi:Serine/threonine protein kinase PrkC, regulator of stationary phase [Myxococcus hansupus]|uniref:non-specific serine/threonine protein kinase n=1 Tax=Pseudomyxococcus hansupus TaxID=1297742 RepID=A0A0H4WZ20_9BACT|nr:serine/threonine-protein kinase [Myxococcus hansupus]AKQ66873.1 Serine/threonine protein kinase PrkC, regulator of stationary phase [Myxococcus hansupus]